MIEKVEVGLENAVFNPHLHGCSVSITGDPRRFYAALARAALTAVREPTETMWRRGSDELAGSAMDNHAFAIQAQKTFRAMIDAALEE